MGQTDGVAVVDLGADPGADLAEVVRNRYPVSRSRLGSIIISESVQREYWPDESPLGKRITIQGAPARVVGEASTRPLLAGLDPAAQREKLEGLLDERKPYYARASIRVDASREAEAVVDAIVAEMHGQQGKTRPGGGSR